MAWFGQKAVPVPNGYDATLPDNALYSSKVINGQLVPVFTARAMYPSQAAAPYFYGNGAKPATLAGFGASTAIGQPVNATTGIGGGAPMYGAMDGGMPGGEWNIQSSPVIWAIAFLIIGFVGLRNIHWRAE